MDVSFEELMRRLLSVKIAVRAAQSAIRLKDWGLCGAYKLPWWSSLGDALEAMYISD